MKNNGAEIAAAMQKVASEGFVRNKLDALGENRRKGPEPRWITVREAYQLRLRDAETIIAAQRAAIEEMVREQTRRVTHPPVPACCYPIMVISDRFEGKYSGGRWIAYVADPDEARAKMIRDSQNCEGGIFGEDADKDKTWWIGIGNTPDIAVAHLMRKALSERLAEHTE